MYKKYSQNIIKYAGFYTAVVLVVFCAAAAGADNNQDTQGHGISEGLESVRIGGAASVLAPKGAESSVDNGVLKVESAGGFAGRKIEGLEGRVDMLEKSVKMLEQRLKDAESNIEQLKSQNKTQAVQHK
jgi:hypothetical protein